MKTLRSIFAGNREGGKALFWYAIIFIAFQILPSCSSGGYSRSYIISDVTHEEVVTESVEQHY